jgi:hypothetical protein
MPALAGTIAAANAIAHLNRAYWRLFWQMASRNNTA